MWLWVGWSSPLWEKEEESKCYAAQKAQAQTDKKLKETLLKLSECDKAWKSVEASIEGFERQAWEHLHHLRKVESQLAIAWAKILELAKELEQKIKEMNKVEHTAYDLGQKEIEAHLQSQIPVVCQSFCIRTWVRGLKCCRCRPFFGIEESREGDFPPSYQGTYIYPISF